MSTTRVSSRKLKGNKTTRYPQYFCFVDTETLPEEKENGKTVHRFRLGVAILARFRKDAAGILLRTIRFRNRDDFWSKALSFISGKNTLHIIAHNILFDMTVLKHRKYLTEAGYDCQFIFEDGFIFIAKWQNGDKRIMLLDNANWFMGKLEKWGSVLNKPKLTMPLWDASDDEWLTYCQRDTEILYDLQKWYLDFLVKNDLGNWRYTLASCSFNAYRHRFMPYPIYIPEESAETALARQSYRGGRTECFYQGEYTDGPYYKLDFNSMYPAIMRNAMYPVRVCGYAKRPDMAKVREYLQIGGVIAHCRVKTNEPYYPINYNGKCAYPIGVFDTTLTTGEMRLAFDNNWLEEIYECAFYKMRPIFTTFVDFFYSERLKWKEDGDILRTLLFKLFLNSLYGKFGQRGFEDKVIGCAEPGTFETCFGYDRVTKEHTVIRQIGRNIIRSLRVGEGYNSFTAVASHVTAYARICLYNHILLAGRNNVYYCDTDSIIVNQQGMNNLKECLSDTELGKLKCEGVSDSVCIKAPKHYLFDERWTIKGLRKNAEQLAINTYRQEIWPGLNKILAQEEEVYYNYCQVKTLNACIESGTILPDGRVIPFVLRGDET